MTAPVCQRPNCGHPHSDHSPLAGCLVQNPSYCSCSGFVGPANQRADDLAEGRRLADEGAAKAYAAEADAWKADAAVALARLARYGAPFTAEDLRREVGRDPVHANAMGSVFRTAHRAGKIVPAGWTTGARAAAHARALRVWRAA